MSHMSPRRLRNGVHCLSPNPRLLLKTTLDPPEDLLAEAKALVVPEMEAKQLPPP